MVVVETLQGLKIKIFGYIFLSLDFNSIFLVVRKAWTALTTSKFTTRLIGIKVFKRTKYLKNVMII